VYTNLAWERLQRDIDLLLTATSTADEFLKGINKMTISNPQNRRF